MANAIANTQAPHGAIAVLRAVNFFASIKEAIVEWNRNRQTYQALVNLSDEQLDDIGLTRADLTSL